MGTVFEQGGPGRARLNYWRIDISASGFLYYEQGEDMQRLIDALKKVDETTLSRVWKHFNNSDIPVALVTAYTQDHTEEENLARNKLLAGNIRAAGYGYVFVDGMFKYPDGSVSNEQSIMAIGNKNDNGKMKGLLRKWVNKYDQVSMLLKPEGEVGKGIEVQGAKSGNDGIDKDVGTFTPDKIGTIYTRLKGRGARTFTFEKATEALKFTWMERLHLENKIKRGEMSEEELALYRLSSL